jgi:nitroreductase
MNRKKRRSEMNYDDFLELVRNRRSIRRFKTDPIPDEYVENIIEAARWAPSGANSQPWEFFVVKDKDTKEKIVELVKEHNEPSRRVELTREEPLRHPSVNRPSGDPGYKDAPVFIILFGDPRTREAYPRMATLTRGASIFVSSQASAFLYMHLAATTLGLGSQWVSATSYPEVQSVIKQLLEVPQNLDLYDMMAVGYPAHEPKARLIRERKELVHYGRYDRGKYRSDEDVNAFIVSLRTWRAKVD